MRAKWTDLAVEACGSASKSDTERLACGMERLTVRIDSERDAQAMGRPCGVYVTLTCPQTMSIALKTRRALARELAVTLRSMLPKARKSILVVGLGNRNVTPDSLGPRTAERILVTRHMAECLPEDIFGYEGSGNTWSMASVSAAAPGVLGVTGMETVEILKGMVTHVQPDAVIAIDALAARSSSRIASTIQIADTGITPGSGVGNHRKALNEQTLGVPVIAVGVPLVVYASTIASDALYALGGGEMEEERIAACVDQVVSLKLGEMVVTPREVDALVERMSGVLADGINQALQPNLTSAEIAQMMAQ